jgi:HAD superfamily hydrolase (TIGR01509 family)
VGYDLIIFDCDGVLVDSEPLANRVFAEALDEVGLAMSFDEVCATFVGLSMSRCVEIVEQRLGRELPADFVPRLQQRTFDAFRADLQAVPGVAGALDRIAAPVCVASSGEHDKMNLTLGLTGLLPRFAGRMFSATEVARGKPWPDLFLHAAATLGAAPERCAVVEDSLPGIRAARAARMAAFGYAPRDDGAPLAASGATVFRSMKELPALLGEARGGDDGSTAHHQR